jgi:hypothetical protein
MLFADFHLNLLQLNLITMKSKLLLIALSLLLFAGCKKHKSEVTDPDHIQQEIWHIYDADNNDTYFGIRFYDTDWYTRVILSPPSYITLNGIAMNFNEVNSFYESKYLNEQVQSGTFLYSDTWERKYTNNTTLEPSVELPEVDTLYKSKDNVISWIGAPCAGSGETITVHVGIALPLATVSTSQAGATSVTIKASDLALWTSDLPIRVYINRTTSGALQMGTMAGGKIQTRYDSKVRWVHIK